MGLRRYVDIIALFLIFLVVLLPIDSSVALAATINSVNAYGRDEFSGYRASTDITVFNVSVSMPEDPDIGPGQVKILEDPTRPFECSIEDDVTKTFTCRSEYPEVIMSASTGVIPFTVQIFNDAGAPISIARQASVVVDSLPPYISPGDLLFSAKPDGVVVASYKVEDKACDLPTCNNMCVGVGSVRFTTSGLDLGTNSSFGPECAQSGEMNLTGLVVGGFVGTKHICIDAADRFGQSATECKDVLIDASPPEVTGIRLIDGNNQPVRYTNGQPIAGVSIEINITEDSAFKDPAGNTQRLRLNASGLTERPDYQLAYGSRTTEECERIGNATNYRCTSSGYFLIATTPREISIGIEAVDENGNILNTTRSVALTFDNTPPVATRIYSSYADDKGAYWVAEENNTISIDITETGSGMSNRYVFLDFSSFGAQPTVTGGAKLLAPNECVSGGSSWTCRWNRIQTDKPSKTLLSLAPQYGSKDDAFNELVSVTGSMYVDRTAPEFINFNITAISDTGTTSYVTSGDMITIHAYIEDHTPVTAVANFSKVMPVAGFDNVAGVCAEFAAEEAGTADYVDSYRVDRNTRLWDCKWEVGPIVEVPRDITTLWTNTSVLFNATDLLMHSAVEEYKVGIMGEENVTPNYWKFDEGSLTQSPVKGLDRFIWGLGQPVSFQHIKIVPDQGDATMLSFDFDPTTCVGDIDYLFYSDAGNAGATYMAFNPVIADGIDDIIMLEFNPSNVPPPTYTTEDNDTFPLDELVINCTAVIRSNVSGARISMLEEENITLRVKLFGNPLGQNIGNVQDEIDRMQKVLGDDWWGVIKWPKIILDYAKIVCDLLDTVNQLRGLWELVTDGFAEACEVSGYFCGTSGSANTAQGELNGRTTGLLDKIGSFCGLVISCRATTPTSFGATERTDATTGDSSYQCGSDDGYCRFMTAWSQWNQKVVGALSGGSLVPEGHGQTLATEQAGGREARIGGVDSMHDMSFVDRSALTGSFDTKKSLISSLLTACLPGIFSGIDKYRQLGCEWLMCYKINIAYGTMTMHQCDSMFYYGICRYVNGEVWNVVPFYQYTNQLMSMVRDFLGDPFMAIGYIVDILCSKLCTSGVPGRGCWLCTIVEFVNVASQITASIYGFVEGEMWKAPMNDICEEALKDEPSYSNLPGFPPEADPATQTSTAVTTEETTTTEVTA